MNKRKMHYIKREKEKKDRSEKEKKENFIGSIIGIVMGIAFCIVNLFVGKAISDGNMFVIFGPDMLIGTIFAVIIIWGLIKGKRRSQVKTGSDIERSTHIKALNAHMSTSFYKKELLWKILHLILGILICLLPI